MHPAVAAVRFKSPNTQTSKTNMKTSNLYFDTLASALEAHIQNIISQGGIFSEDPSEMYIFAPPVSYGHTWQDSRELASLKGKKTRKWAHSSIYRMDSGRYELTSYLA